MIVNSKEGGEPKLKSNAWSDEVVGKGYSFMIGAMIDKRTAHYSSHNHVIAINQLFKQIHLLKPPSNPILSHSYSLTLSLPLREDLSDARLGKTRFREPTPETSWHGVSGVHHVSINVWKLIDTILPVLPDYPHYHLVSTMTSPVTMNFVWASRESVWLSKGVSEVAHGI